MRNLTDNMVLLWIPCKNEEDSNTKAVKGNGLKMKMESECPDLHGSFGMAGPLMYACSLASISARIFSENS